MSDKILLRFNLNYTVYLKLTELDFIHWHKHCNDILPPIRQAQYPLSYYKEKEDKETGYTQMQLHEYITVFNDRIGAGSLLPANGNIYFDLKSFDNI